MASVELGEQQKRRFRNIRSFVLIIIGIFVNMFLSDVASAFGLPLYLDCVGTVIAASLSGYIPGIVVGLTTNLLKFSSDSTSIYYGILNVLIGLVAAYATRRKFHKKISGILLLIVSCSVIGGIGGTILTWILYGFANTGITSDFARKIYSLGIFNEFFSQLIADLFWDLVDKTITIGIVTTLLLLLPDALKRSFRLYGWKQTPLSQNIKSEVRKVVTGAASLRTKIIILITAAMLIIAVAALSIGFILYRNGIIDTHADMATGVANVVANSIDADKVDEYMSKGNGAEGYSYVDGILKVLKDSSEDIDRVYVCQFVEGGYRVVFDTNGNTDANRGELNAYDSRYSKMISSFLAGEDIEPVVDNGSGYMSVFVPVKDNSGNIVCYACADVAMSHLNSDTNSFFVKLISLFLGVFILILAVGLWLAHYNIIVPVNSMAVSAGHFAFESEESLEESVERLRDLHIETGDEIENLYHSFVKTSEDSVNYVNDIQNKTDTISKLQNGLILVLADIVESRDECTGDHVRKTASYSGIILEGLRELGYHKDIITDSYINDVISGAPLHDIGKIKIPDKILNSRSKLTQEEFEIMKTHTIHGALIIESAIDIVPDSGYLNEAKNMAEYHHEKWNGTGYPKGLAGEDIPLSARVLAIADVFDALISRRSYKEPFTFDQAASIIKKDAGTHFDPQAVEAFYYKLDEIRKASEEFAHINNKLYDNGIIH